MRSLIIIYNWLVSDVLYTDRLVLFMRFDKESGEWRDGEIATDHVGLVGGAVIYINVSV